ncbi:phage holin family protein [Salipaludibacillus agaradhaerens]|jgi:putative membrane protein|uniref:phage holin family protein n=1 Tax=Salipaludibacillus agaradhaerens TaxID=76935 RepID=UPI000998AD0A|nr:phage holin family protein [Salipaludibacillus agaradhaerens]MCR6107957.1 phage holin family protein [Salipaludibacillus agaradhaerens]MCR6119983.1 phage holin family protein [Salipaludibacillus agaradhaerens]UJW59034.1 phage holin family protein [Bacillus sp. A116_S68]
MGWLLQIIVNAAVLLIIAHFFQGVEVAGISSAIVASVILAIVNLIVKPILVVLTLPVTVMSLGLFLFVINAVTLMLTASIMGSSFVIEGFGLAIVVAIIFAILSALIHSFVVDPFTKR